MFCCRNIIIISFISHFFIFLSMSLAMVDPIPIDSIEEVGKKIKSLRKDGGVKADKICVVFDFHGVIVEQEEHKPPFSLKGNIKNILQYLKDENIPTVVATAWDNFNAVIQEGIEPLGLKDFFDVDPNYTATLKSFTLGLNSMNLEGYINGRVVALKYKRKREALEEDLYFRQKAFAVEVCYQNNPLKYIIFVDDLEKNLKIFQEDSNELSHTGKPDFEEVILYHLQKGQ